MSEEFDLIVSIANKHYSEKIVQASKEAGAEGGTILYGRGTGIRETQTILGIPVEPEKEVVLTIVPKEISEQVLSSIMHKAELEKPGAGIAFVVDLKKVVGISHRSGQEQ
ncbi:MAG: P-II family nitrogen regulator [Desulfohalobiaceae bacterium]